QRKRGAGKNLVQLRELHGYSLLWQFINDDRENKMLNGNLDSAFILAGEITLTTAASPTRLEHMRHDGKSLHPPHANSLANIVPVNLLNSTVCFY
ncbi:MAG TPA: hypothetical protein PK725_14030, partial [Rhodocyclaceae bacterium]|nr:hypothetical protein [Rhodocyclaceae bacterium]